MRHRPVNAEYPTKSQHRRAYSDAEQKPARSLRHLHEMADR
jgi:hypothetical protein